MKYPKISLVTTCYNHQDFIAETIESILSQNYPNLEYIVIDDGSTDGSWEIIQKYKDKLTYCERMEGYRDTPTIALNYALSKTTGEIMGWLNSDDVLLPKSLFTIAKVFTDVDEAEWITGMATTINERSEIINSRLRLKNKYDFLTGDWKVIQQESTFWRRSLWERAGGYLEGKHKWAFDTELWTRFFFLAEHYHVDTSLGAFRQSGQSKSTSNKDSFLTPNGLYLLEMKKRAGFGLRFRAFLFWFSKRFLSLLLRSVPIGLLRRIPILRNLCYAGIFYSFQTDTWQTVQFHPYKKR
jgi:glycosyltransferase involved in cell wall biosynthesis